MNIEDSMVPPPFTGGRGDESFNVQIEARGSGGGARAPGLEFKFVN